MILARAALLLSGAAVIGVAVAEEDQEPDMAFLEYLGMWEETDEDWQLFVDASDDEAVAENEERSDPAPKGKESQELEDES